MRFLFTALCFGLIGCTATPTIHRLAAVPTAVETMHVGPGPCIRCATPAPSTPHATSTLSARDIAGTIVAARTQVPLLETADAARQAAALATERARPTATPRPTRTPVPTECTVVALKPNLYGFNPLTMADLTTLPVPGPSGGGFTNLDDALGLASDAGFAETGSAFVGAPMCYTGDIFLDPAQVVGKCLWIPVAVKIEVPSMLFVDMVKNCP
jgi:hypothetical protein